MKFTILILLFLTACAPQSKTTTNASALDLATQLNTFGVIGTVAAAQNVSNNLEGMNYETVAATPNYLRYKFVILVIDSTQTNSQITAQLTALENNSVYTFAGCTTTANCNLVSGYNYVHPVNFTSVSSTDYVTMGYLFAYSAAQDLGSYIN